MPFIPHTEDDIKSMLGAIGASSLDALFDEIPAELKAVGLTQVPPSLPEMAVARLMHGRAAIDGAPLNFVGAGAYEHHIPAAVWEITTRGEFYSAYTPYQAEASQGTLQVLYEYQTMMTALTGMEVSNPEFGTLALTADVLRSFTGDLGADEIAISTEAHSAACGFPIAVGETATVVLHPMAEAQKDGVFAINLCTSMPVNDASAVDVLEEFADRRAAGEGVWVDVVAFQRLLATNPSPAELRAAFPEVLVILPDEMATREFRFDQSRFFAMLDDAGRVYGGEFG